MKKVIVSGDLAAEMQNASEELFEVRNEAGLMLGFFAPSKIDNAAGCARAVESCDLSKTTNRDGSKLTAAE